MEIEIVKKQANPLLKRTDVTFRVTHPKEKTPQRGAVRDKLAGIVGSPREAVIIDYMRSQFGISSTQGFAKCYGSADEAKKMEPQFLLRRHGLVEAKKEEKKEGAPAPPPPPPKAAERPAAPAKPAEKPAAALAKPAEKAAEKHPPKPAEKPAAEKAEKPAAEKKK